MPDQVDAGSINSGLKLNEGLGGRVGDFDHDSGLNQVLERYLRFLIETVRGSGYPDFRLLNSFRLNDESFLSIADVNPALARNLLEFTNTFYKTYEAMVRVPEYRRVRTDCRGYCDGCEEEGAWKHADKATMPQFHDVQFPPPLSPMATHEAQLAHTDTYRRIENDYYNRLDTWNAEHPSEFTCEEDCDRFIEYVDNSFSDQVQVDTLGLKRAYRTFIENRGGNIDLEEPEPMWNAHLWPRPAPVWEPPLQAISTIMRRERRRL